MFRVCAFNGTGATQKHLRQACAAIANVTVVGEVFTWNELQEALLARGFDVVLVNLDMGGDSECIVVRRISEIAPEIGIVGVSSNADAETIINALRAGCHQFVRWPIEASDLLQALDQLGKGRAVAATEPPNPRMIAVMGSAGGAGATTLASNLALELAHLTHQRCALVDMDLQFGDVALAFDCTPQYSIADACKHGAEIDQSVVESVLHKLPCDVSILARPARVGDGDEITPQTIEQLIHMLGRMHSFVIADLPRVFTPQTLAVLGATDRVLIVTQLSVPFLRNAERIRHYLRHIGANDDHIEFVVNRSNASFERITLAEATQHLGKPIFAAVPNDYRRVTAARDLGHPIMSNSPNSPARLAIQDLARKFIGAAQPAADEASANGGLLSFLRRKPKAKANV
jgi:pilus assembly protein CpaE